ncbi:MAG: hypothetical protein ACOY3E_13370 [Pseudomonadota bacterium]
MKTIAYALLATLLPLAMTGTAVSADEAADGFFAALRAQCGARYVGASGFPLDPSHDFAGKVLIAEIRSCQPDEIRIPFAVGEDRSRTWILRREADGLSWKHDHRHADGSPDAVTMYGGMATAGGTALQQAFAADAYTAALLPAAATNVWTVTLAADGSTLTYHLARHGQPRYEAVLHRQPAQP